MKKKALLFIFAFFAILIMAEFNDVQLVAVAGEDENIFYDHDSGIYRNGDNIYLAYYRYNDDYETRYFDLKLSISTDGGTEYIECDVLEYVLENSRLQNELANSYLPSVWADENGTIYIFYLDMETAKAMIAVSSDLGETFSIEPLGGIPGRSQFRVLKTDNGVVIGSMECPANIPMSRFQYLTKYEESENLESYNPEDHSGDVNFWGQEHYHGIIASDDDIWIRQAGGGTNNGWPTFDDMVITSGRIMDYPTGVPAVNSAPMDDIFRGGYIENSAHFTFPAVAEEIRENGITLDESEDHDVLLAEIEGNIAHLRYADWLTQVDTFTVYNSFPDPVHPDLAIGDSIWTNEVMIKELVWDGETTDLTVENTSVFVYCDLWIEGSIGSNMTWGCADTVYITSDICYSDIEPGDPAEDSEYIFGLVSEERILYKYKYKDSEGIIHDDNCNDIYLYGSYAALGDGDYELYGDMNTHYEGIITTEYQHPHGSTPAFTIETPEGNWIVEYPDLHKFIFPPDPLWTGDQGMQFHGGAPVIGNNGFDTCGYPYENPGYGDYVTTPYGADYPWYNPVYPEASCSGMGERGYLRQFGGKQQRRFGYVHRSGSDPNNHSGNNWDIDHWQYSGTHGSVGYGEYYHWDTRLDSIAPPDYPEIDVMLGLFPVSDEYEFSIYSFDPATISANLIEHHSIDLDDQYKMVDFCWSDEKDAFLVSNLYQYSEYKIVSLTNDEWSVIEIEDILSKNSIEIWGDNYIIKGNAQIDVFDAEGNPLILPDLNQFSSRSDFQPTYDGILFSITGEHPLWNIELRQAGDIPLLESYDFSFATGSIENNTSLEIQLLQADQMLMQFVERPDSEWEFSTGYIYVATGDISDILTGTIDDEIVMSPQFNCYPNPFNPELNLSFSLDHEGLAEITIYNIKGQIVDQVINDIYPSGDYICTWKAPSNSSGIYLARYKINDQLISCRKLTLLK